MRGSSGSRRPTPTSRVTYDPVGSGGGRENFIAGAFPLAGSDAYLRRGADEGELTGATERCGAAT